MEDIAIVRELLNLKSYVSDPSFISFQKTCLQSDTALCAQTIIDGQRYVIQLNPRNPSLKEQHKMNADLVAPHPIKKILALKGGTTIQVYDFELQSKIKTFKMNENVDYMRWLDPATLVVVTSNAVYHCKMDADSMPELIFQRMPQLVGCNIINYKVDSKRTWCLLIGSKFDPTTQTLQGVSQTYNIAKRKTQFLPAQSAAFVTYRPEGRKQDANLLVMAAMGKLHITELDTPEGCTPIKLIQDIRLVDPKDIPLSIEYSSHYGLIYVVTAMGVLYGYDVASAALALMKKICNDTVFSTVSEDRDYGVICLNQGGQVLSVTVNPKTIIPFIKEKLRNIPLAISIASRANLSGTDDLFVEQFEAFFQQGNYQEAARVAATSPNGCLRTATVIQRFKTAPALPGTAPPLMQYLVKVLEITKLNDRESLELVMPVMKQQQKQMVQTWLDQDKLTASEELGDFLRQYDRNLALAVYLQSRTHEKVVQLYCELEEYEKVVSYSKEQNYKAPYLDLFRGVCQLSPAGAEKFCKLLYSQPEGSLIDLGEAMEIFYQFDLIKELTAVVVDILSANEASMSRLQTRYLEIMLLKRPDVADALFSRGTFTQYDQNYIAHCCEKAGLYHRALEHYDDLQDILRCIVHTNAMTQEFVCKFISAISKQQDPKIGMACLQALTKNKANLNLCVAVCQSCQDVLDQKEMIKVLETNNMVDGVYLFLQGIATTTTDKDLVFRFINSAVKMGKYKDVEKVVRESKYYDPKEVKDFLKESKIEPQSLMIVCDRYGYVDELVKYLYQNDQRAAIERYVSGFGHKSAPLVVGTLLDLEASEEFINKILDLVVDVVDVAALSEECEKRNRLRILQRFLEDLVSNHDNKDEATHSSLAKIYVETNQNADAFLQDNPYYNSLVVGKFCEKRDPRRAVICYRRGKCDKELIELTNKNSFFKEQAKYLVERKDVDLWMTVLSEENENRRSLIDQVISSAMPQCKDAEEVSTTVKAFQKAGLSSELIELLEVIMLRKTDFSSHKNLQNLLLITAIKTKSTKLRDYINRLDNYDGFEVAKFAIRYNLYEEAFEMFKKFQHFAEAIGVLLDNLDDVERAYDFAVEVNTKECWSLIAKGQLNHGLIEKAIDSYLKAEDPSNYVQVITACTENNLYEPLVNYLKMARVLHEQMIDSELVYAYAKIDRLAEIEEFINQSNQADLQSIGDRCFDDKLYNAARILYNHIGNYARLASTLICLGQLQNAVEAAKKAQQIKTWKEVCFACVEAQQFRLAQSCGINIVVVAEELNEVIDFYLERGHFDKIIDLLEYAIHLENTHVGLFTELGILYSKFKPEKLLEFIKLFHSNLNIPTLLKVCESNLQWSEMCLLHTHYEEFDYAAIKMMDHIDAWNHTQFKDIIQKVSNIEIYYKAIDVYINQHPNVLCDLLTVMAPRVDNSRVVAQLRRANQLALIRPYLLFVQQSTKPEISDVNEAVNDLYLEEEDVDALRSSVENYPTFDQIALARRLETHELLRFRRLASWLYTRNKRFEKAVELSKKDKMYQDAMEATAASGNKKTAEELLYFFATKIDEKDKAPCFAACLYTCYEIIDPDTVMEIAWMNNLREFAMPYFINTTREFNLAINSLREEVDQLKEQKKEEESERVKQMSDEVDAVAAVPSTVTMGGIAPVSPMGMPGMATSPMAAAVPMGGANPMMMGSTMGGGFPAVNPQMNMSYQGGQTTVGFSAAPPYNPTY